MEVKRPKQSGRVLILSGSSGKKSNRREYPDFGSVTNIYSHHSEEFGIISVLVFLDKCCRSLIFKFELKIIYYCDSLKVVTKSKQIKKKKNCNDILFRITYHDALLLIITYMTSQMNISHVR